LTNVDAAAAEAVPIPEEMPPELLQKHTSIVEGIGEPTTARFLTQTTTDPSNWYHSSFLSICLLIAYSICIGGCLKNMMECGAFGILLKSYSIRGKGGPLTCPKRL